MNKNTLKKIREKIGQYYQENKVEAPPKIEEREFGVGNQEKINYRHLGLESEEELNKYLVTEKPRFISYSAAYYEYPEKRPMKRKQYKKGDLAFDLDHECPHNTLTCYQCLEKVKQETQKLIDNFLINDFGYDPEQIEINFSGNKGYHVKIRDPRAQSLTEQGRKEIVDYIMANDLITPEFEKNGPKPTEKGWRGKIAREILKFVKQSDREKMKELGINSGKIKHLIDRREQIIQGIKKGNYDTLPGPETLWERVLEKRKIQLKTPIDHPVTLDTSRLMRLPDTIHGGSSLLAKEISREELEDFNPFNHAVVFGEEPTNIKITKETPKIHLNNETHGPYESGQEIETKEYVAVFLASKQHAKPEW